MSMGSKHSCLIPFMKSVCISDPRSEYWLGVCKFPSYRTISSKVEGHGDVKKQKN